MADKREWWKQGPVAKILEESKLQKTMGGQNMDAGRFTGLGPDGKLQNGNVAAINNFAEHEGEFVVDAKRVRAIGGPDELNKILTQAGGGAPESGALNQSGGADGNQQQLNMQAENMPGFGFGGLVSAQDAAIKKDVEGKDAERDRAKSLENKAIVEQGGLPGRGDTLAPSVPELEDIKLGGQSLRDFTTSPEFQQDKAAQEAGEKFIAGRPGVSKDSVDKLRGLGVQEETPEATEDAGAIGGAGAGIGDASTAAFNTGMNRLTSLAQGDDPILRQQANQILNRISLMGAAEKAALNQQIAQQGLGAGLANALGAEISREIGSELAQASGEIAIGAQQRGLSAATTAAQVGLQGVQFKTQQDSAQLNTQIAAGDFTGANETASNMGWNVDFSKVEDAADRQNLNTGLANATNLISTGQYDTVDDAMTDQTLLEDLKLAYNSLSDEARGNQSLEDYQRSNIDRMMGAQTVAGRFTAAIPLADAVEFVPGVAGWEAGGYASAEEAYNAFKVEVFPFYNGGGIGIEGNMITGAADIPGYAAYAKWMGLETIDPASTTPSTTMVTTTDADGNDTEVPLNTWLSENGADVNEIEAPNGTTYYKNENGTWSTSKDGSITSTVSDHLSTISFDSFNAESVNYVLENGTPEQIDGMYDNQATEIITNPGLYNTQTSNLKPNTPLYDALTRTSPPFNVSAATEQDDGLIKFDNASSVYDGAFITINGQLYQVEGDMVDHYATGLDDEFQSFKVKNLSNNKSETIVPPGIGIENMEEEGIDPDNIITIKQKVRGSLGDLGIRDAVQSAIDKAVNEATGEAPTEVPANNTVITGSQSNVDPKTGYSTTRDTWTQADEDMNNSMPGLIDSYVKLNIPHANAVNAMRKSANLTDKQKEWAIIQFDILNK